MHTCSYSYKQFVAVTVLSFVFIPLGAQAAVVTFEQEGSAHVGVYIDPQRKELNVVEGVIRFQGKAVEDLSVQVENGKSALPLWPTPPVYDEKEHLIRFTGGVPGGISSKSLLFRLKLSAPQPMPFELSYSDGSAYLNDGKGTKDDITSQPLSITVDATSASDEVGMGGDNKLFKGGIIILLIIALCVIARYGYKKFITH